MTENKTKLSLRRIITSPYFTFGVTIVLFVILYIVGITNFNGFSKPQVFFNLFIDNAAVIMLTIGITFVLLTGNIDLSGASVIAFTCMLVARLLRDTGLPVSVVVIIALAFSTLFGYLQGFLITRFSLQSYIVTLAGQFLLRGATAMISIDTIDISRPIFAKAAQIRVPIFGLGFVSLGVIIALVALVIGTFVLRKTTFGRNLYATGGNLQSAALMGIPTDKTKRAAYAVSGFCAGLGGLLFALTMLSGYTLHALGMELEAISSSVIGGTLLSGGVAFLPGTLFGVLIQGVIQTLINFQGNLSAWWTRIVIAALLCLAIVFQSLIQRSRERVRSK